MKQKCPRCGYTWDYNGNLLRVTCPNCGRQWFVSKDKLKPKVKKPRGGERQ